MATFLVPVFLAPDQQGYFYTFASVLAIQVFFELGLSQVLLYRFSALNQTICKEESSSSADKLGVLLYASRWIYVVIAILFFVVASLGGYAFLSRSGNYQVQWQPQWFVLVLATAINLAHSIKLVYLESQGAVADVATFRFKVGIISTVLLIAVLSMGGALWAAVVVPLVTAFSTSFWLCKSRKTLLYRDGRSLVRRVKVNEIRQIWRLEIFPLQWRMSLSWISGYFIFQLVTPVAFQRFGPAIAGQLGFAISAMNSILFVSTTFTSSIAPRLSALFNSSNIAGFNSAFDKSFRRSVIAVIVLTQLLVLLVYLVPSLVSGFSYRLLPWNQLQIYSLVVIMSAISYCWSIYLRSQSIEPLLLQSVITALAMAPAIWFSSLISISSMLLSMAFISGLSTLAAWRIYSSNRLGLL